jgi:hypothetical protein
MADLFSKNGFNVLGLDASASQKQINHRAKELINLLKIDEVPDYDQDLPFLKITRTESSVKVALQNLTSPTKRISDYLYWFDQASADDEASFKKLADNKTAEVVTKWHGDAEPETAKGFIAKRNLAVLLSILVGAGTKQYLGRSLRTWDDLINSDKFWLSFTKIYQLNDELGTSSEAIAHIQKDVVNILADYYTDVSKELGDSSIVAEFQKTFKVKGAKVEKDLLAPVYAAINDASAKLIALKISNEQMISKQKMAELKGLVITLRNSFNKLKDIGLYDDSQSKTMRDKAAEAMRSVALDLYNNLNDSSKSGSILKIALEITGTPTLKARIKDDLDDLKKLVSRDKIIEPITSAQEADKHAKALDLIVDAQNKYPNNKLLQDTLTQRLKWSLTALAVTQFQDGSALYDKKKYAEAVDVLTSNAQFIYSYLEDTDISKEYVDNMIAEINRLTALLGKDQKSGQAVDNLRNSIVEQAQKHFKDQFEQNILIALIDSVVLGNLAKKIPELKRQKQIKTAVGWAITIGIFIIIGVASNNNSSNNNSSGSSGSSGSGTTQSSSGSGETAAQQQACSQASALKTQIDQINSQMTTYQNEGDQTDYNNDVPQQNSLVNQYNALLPTCNGTSQ